MYWYWIHWNKAGLKHDSVYRASMKSEAAPAKRRYNSSRRSMQAAQTRADILEAAQVCFRESGWAGTTLAAIAERAGVAVETIYSSFGSKKALLRSAMEVSVVGDAEEVPLIEREEWRQLAVGTRKVRMEKGAAMVTEIHERSAAIWAALLEASASDPEVDAWRRELDAGRKVDLAKSFEQILERTVEGPELDVLWALYSSEVYVRLTDDAGMSRAAYGAALTDATLRILGSGRRR
jgi:AcrR family transcriptional regulator